MGFALLLLARWASAERSLSDSCEQDATGGVCLLQQSFLQRSTAGESKVGILPIPESNSGSFCRLKDVMPYWSVPGMGTWKGMTKYALSCSGQFSYCDRVREAAETQCRLVVLEPFACVGGAGERDTATYNGALMPIPDPTEELRFKAVTKESTFEVDGNVFLCSMFSKIMEVDESQATFDTWRLRVTKTRVPGDMRLAIQDLDVQAESVEYGHKLMPMHPSGEGEYAGNAGVQQLFDNRGEDTFPLIDSKKSDTPGAITWSYDEPVCISEIRFQTAKEGWWNCANGANCADPVQWVLEGEEKAENGEHLYWVPVLIQDTDFPMPEERATYTDAIPVQECHASEEEKEALHTESKAEVEQNAEVPRTKYRFSVKKTKPGHHSGRMMFHMQEIEFDADRQPVRIGGTSSTGGAGPDKLTDKQTENNPYVDATATKGSSWHPEPLDIEFDEPTCIRAFRFMTSKNGWWSCNGIRCGDPLQWELEGFEDRTDKLTDKYQLNSDLIGDLWVPVQLQYEDYPVPAEQKTWTDWIPVSTCGGARYFDEFRFTLVKTPGGHFSGNMMFALDELEIDAVGKETHNKLEPINPENVGGHNPAGGTEIRKAFDGMVGVAGDLPFIDDSAGAADYPKTPGTIEWSLRETGCISRFRFATASKGWWTCDNNVCADPIQWTLEGKLDENGADWVMLQDQSTDYPTPTARSTFTDWIAVSDCEKSETQKALADSHAMESQTLAAQRRLAYRFRMTKSAKPHWSGRMLLALAEFALDTDPPTQMSQVGIENPGGDHPERVVFLTDEKVSSGEPFFDLSSVEDDTKPEAAPLEFHFMSPVCVNKFRFATPQDAEDAWWYGSPPTEEYGIPSQWVFEGQNNDGEWVPIQTQATDFTVPSRRGEWADWVTVASCSSAPDSVNDPLLNTGNLPVVQETATVEVTYTHIIGYQIKTAPGAVSSPEMKNDLTYGQCEEVCVQQADCAGFLMESKAVSAGAAAKCFIYTTDQWTDASECVAMEYFDVFIKPSVGYDVNAKCQ